MKTTRLIIGALLLSAVPLATMTSCTDDDTPVVYYSVSLDITLPPEITDADIISENYTFRNVTTGTTTQFDNKVDITLTPGLYDILYTAIVRLSNGVESTMRAKKESVEIHQGDNKIELTAYNTIESNDLIIAEIFNTGTTTAAGGQIRDTYIKLYNNTDHVIYADGLSLFESDFATTQKYDYTPDVMADAVIVRTLYTVPGDGTRFPVNPGEYFLMVDRANDNRITNALSFDLTHADVEWYDESSVASQQDTDNPDVPNMLKVYSYSKSITILDQGQRAFGIARIDNASTFITDNVYNATYPLVIPSTGDVRTMTKTGYFVPNGQIVDMVTIAPRDNFVWNVSSPAIDCGWTYVALNSSDKTRYFQSVRRKMLYINDDGNPVLKDTNNSTDDFNARVAPSEIELQGTALNADGTLCTTRTYDGVTPVK